MSPTEAPTGLNLKDPGHGVASYRRGSAVYRLGRAAFERIDISRVRIVHLSGVALALSARSCTPRSVPPTHHGAIVSFDVNHRPAHWSVREEAVATTLAAAGQADTVLTGRDEARGLWRTAVPAARIEVVEAVPARPPPAEGASAGAGPAPVLMVCSRSPAPRSGAPAPATRRRPLRWLSA